MVQKRNNLSLEIIKELSQSEHHIRGLAKKLDESHSTVLRKLNSFKQESVIDSRDEGRNKIFYIKKNLASRAYILQMESYKLTNLLSHNPELRVIFEEVLAHSDDPLVILFGSYAKGLEKKESDIDIYVGTKNRNVKKKIEELHPNINVKIGSFDLNSPLIKEIVKNHIILRGIEVFYEKSIPK